MNDIGAYLYTLTDDHELRVHEGRITPPAYGRQHHIRFTPDKGNWSYVSCSPGEVYYRKLWLKERDDERANRIYLDYHRRKIEELERQIDMHRRAGAALLKEIGDGDISI